MDPILIEVKQDRPGFDGFISAWLCCGDLNMVVDVGPSNSVHRLIESLRGRDVDRLDYVLLTHIHIDHAGGLADLLEQFPMAKVICHGKGIKHLVDPSRLWSGSLSTLGEVAESYGPIKPVQQECLIPHTDARVKDLDIFETPGHAPHHLSFAYQNNLFVGETGGNYFSAGGEDYLRPATPPRFFPEVFLESIDKLLGIEEMPIFYGHFGRADGSHRMLQRFREQLLRWSDIIKQERPVDDANLLDGYVDRLLEKDPDLRNFHLLEPDVQQRERFFLTNSTRGYVGFFKDNP